MNKYKWVLLPIYLFLKYVNGRAKRAELKTLSSKMFTGWGKCVWYPAVNLHCHWSSSVSSIYILLPWNQRATSPNLLVHRDPNKLQIEKTNTQHNTRESATVSDGSLFLSVALDLCKHQTRPHGLIARPGAAKAAVAAAAPRWGSGRAGGRQGGRQGGSCSRYVQTKPRLL